jgi:hypothetical protein
MLSCFAAEVLSNPIQEKKAQVKIVVASCCLLHRAVLMDEDFGSGLEIPVLSF